MTRSDDPATVTGEDILMDGALTVVDLCDGSGPRGSDVTCGAEHVADGATLDADLASHACTECGAYTPGAACHDAGLCDECEETDDDADLVDKDGDCRACGHPADGSSGHGSCDSPAHRCDEEVSR